MFRNALALALLSAASLSPELAHASHATAQPAPTVVLVHGAFADASSWSKVVPVLESWGTTVVTVQLPLTSLADDAEATRRAIAAAPGKVVLVGHSWGGTVITEAGVDDKVSSLVYVAAFAPDVGEATGQQGKPYPVPPGLAGLQERNGLLWLSQDGAHMDFAQDLSVTGARRVFDTQLPIRASAFAEPVQHAAWKTKPSWYVVTRQDRMIAPQLQTATARRIDAQIVSLATSHVPMLSRPNDVAYTILEAAGVKQKDAEPHEGG